MKTFFKNGIEIFRFVGAVYVLAKEPYEETNEFVIKFVDFEVVVNQFHGKSVLLQVLKSRVNKNLRHLC